MAYMYATGGNEKDIAEFYQRITAFKAIVKITPPNIGIVIENATISTETTNDKFALILIALSSLLLAISFT